MTEIVGALTISGVTGGVLYAVGRVWWAVLVARFGPPEKWRTVDTSGEAAADSRASATCRAFSIRISTVLLWVT